MVSSAWSYNLQTSKESLLKLLLLAYVAHLKVLMKFFAHKSSMWVAHSPLLSCECPTNIKPASFIDIKPFYSGTINSSVKDFTT